MLPFGGDGALAERVAEHARDLYAEALAEVPERGAVVCTLVAEYARSSALAAYLQVSALREGVGAGGAGLALAKYGSTMGQQARAALDAAWAHAARVRREGAVEDEGGDGFAVVPTGAAGEESE